MRLTEWRQEASATDREAFRIPPREKYKIEVANNSSRTKNILTIWKPTILINESRRNRVKARGMITLIPEKKAKFAVFMIPRQRFGFSTKAKLNIRNSESTHNS